VRGDEVLACIVLRKAPNLPPPESIAHSIVRHALDRLSYFKAPGYVAFVETLPLTVSQKIQRSDLRELARRLPGSPTCFDVRMLKRRKKHLDAAATAAGALATAPSGPGSLASPTEYGAAPPSVPGDLGSARAPGLPGGQAALSGIVLTGPPGPFRAPAASGSHAPAASPAPPTPPGPAAPPPSGSRSGAGGGDDDDDR